MAWTGTYAIVFPIRGQIFEFTGFIKDATTANPIATIGTLTLAVSLDGAAPVANTSTVAAITSMNGGFKVALSAADMTANVITWTVTSNTADAVVATGEIKTINLTERTDHWRDQTVLRLEDAVKVPAEYIQNQVTQDNTTNQITVYAKGSTSSVLWQQSDVNASGLETKGEATS